MELLAGADVFAAPDEAYHVPAGGERPRPRHALERRKERRRAVAEFDLLHAPTRAEANRSN